MDEEQIDCGEITLEALKWETENVGWEHLSIGEIEQLMEGEN